MRTRWAGLAFALTATLLPGVPQGMAAQESRAFYEDFRPGWEERWTFQRLDADATRFTAVDEDSGVIEARSRNAAGGIGRELDLESAPGLDLSWRWRVERPLPDVRHEREAEGDDYAGRIMVAFDGDLFNGDTPVLCYVWSSVEPVGSVYPNPYRDNVMTVVVRRGGPSGVWRLEERNLVADYREVFGGTPERVTGIAFVVDTDDTGGTVTTRLDEVTLSR